MNYTLAISGHYRERWENIEKLCRAERVCNLFDVDAGKHLADMPDWQLPGSILSAADPYPVPRYLYLFDLMEGGFVHGMLSEELGTAEFLWRTDEQDIKDLEARFPAGIPDDLPATAEPGVPQAIFDTETGQLLKGES